MNIPAILRLHALRRFVALALLSAVAVAQGATAVAPAALDVTNDDQVRAYLEANIAKDKAMVAFYVRVGRWDRVRDLHRLHLPPKIWDHLSDARTRLVKQLYAEVHAEMLTRHGVYFNDPKKETHFIGTPPSHPDFKGVFSDLDIGMFLDPATDPKKRHAVLSVPEKLALAIDAKRLMEKKLHTYGPDSGDLLDTNLYTTPGLRFDPDELSESGRRDLERYDDVLAYLALRVGCDSDLRRWLDLKQGALKRAHAEADHAVVEPYVRGLIDEAESKYATFGKEKNAALASLRRQKLDSPGVADQAVTTHFERVLYDFISRHGRHILAQDPAGENLRFEFNKLKADYEASLRESYLTDAAQKYIVTWQSVPAAQQAEFLADPNKVRRVRADQARFLLHYLQHPPGEGPDALRFKVQKLAKYELRELNVVRDAGQNLVTLTGFNQTEIAALFAAMKGQSTPDEAWELWRAMNFNRLLKRDLGHAVAKSEVDKAEANAIARAKAYLAHIQQKLVKIATDLPVPPR